MTSLSASLPKADIGVFDSGLGGLSVLREIQRQAPSASVLYLADTANVPYGDKPIAVVRDLALQLTDRLIDAGVQLVIMASGTSTAAGLEAARNRYPALPIAGTIAPGAAAAVSASAGPVGVLATNATVQSRAFTKSIHGLDPTREVVEVGCPQFVPLVETGCAETTEAEEAALEYLRPLHNTHVQSVILGCTHFPFLLNALHHAVSQIADPEFQPHFVDPAAAAVRDALPLLSLTSGGLGTVSFAASGDPEEFRCFASRLLGTPIDFVAPLAL